MQFQAFASLSCDNEDYLLYFDTWEDLDITVKLWNIASDPPVVVADDTMVLQDFLYEYWIRLT